jgi:hypothetical protein
MADFTISPETETLRDLLLEDEIVTLSDNEPVCVSFGHISDFTLTLGDLRACALPRGFAQRSKDDAIAVALFDLVAIIEAAGLQNLVKGVELGQTSWYVKASDRIAAAYAALSDTSTLGNSNG